MDLNPCTFLADCPLAAGPVHGGRCWWCQRILTGRQRKWCCTQHGMEYLENHHWSYARKAALHRDRNTCVRCESRVSPEVHHLKPVLGKHKVNGCHHHLDGLITLCHECHQAETRAQRSRGELPRRKRRKRRKTKRR